MREGDCQRKHPFRFLHCNKKNGHQGCHENEGTQWVNLEEQRLKELAKPKPTDEDRKAGFKTKYIVTHADGTPTDVDAEYFVLRLDYHNNCDVAHVEACRQAILNYADHIRNHLPILAGAIKVRYASEIIVNYPQNDNHAPNGDIFASAPGMRPVKTCKTCVDKTQCVDDGTDCRKWTGKKYSGPACLFKDVPIGAVAVFPQRQILKWSSEMSVKIEGSIYCDNSNCDGWYWPGEGKNT